MKLLARLGLVLMVFGVCAFAASADNVSATSSTDFRVILNDPSCQTGYTCVPIGYDGSTQRTYNFWDPLLFLNPDPNPIPEGQTAACSSDVFAHCLDLLLWNFHDPSDPIFAGVAFWDGSLNPNEDLDIGVTGYGFSLFLPSNFECDGGGCSNGIINLTATPEPPTIFLLLGGLALLAILGRKRFGATPFSRVPVRSF